MHEFSLMKNLLKKIESLALQHQATKVVRVKVRLGALGHISKEHFQEHFVHGTQGTIAQDAKLEVILETDTESPHAQEILLEDIDVQ